MDIDRKISARLMYGVAMVALMSPAAMAQSAAPPAAQAAPKPPASLQDIVVTANRTRSLALKTPITVSAIRGTALVEAGVTNPTQLAALVPSVIIERGNANGLLINIRGIQSNGGDPSVGFMLDGIYIEDAKAQEVSFFDINRVEVLRGPQGTLYGRNTPAGVINVITNAPTFKYGGSANVGYGSYNAVQGTAVLNIPASDVLAFRVAGNYDYRDSFLHIAVPSAYGNPPDEDTKSVRFSTLYQPSDALKSLTRFDYSDINGNGNAFGNFPLASNFYKMPIGVPSESYLRTPDPIYIHPSASQALAQTYANPYPTSTNMNSWGIMEDLEWNINDALTASYLGSYRQFNVNNAASNYFGSSFSSPTSFTNVLFPISLVANDETVSHEARLALNTGKLHLQGGLYYFNESGSSFYNFTIFQANTPYSYDHSEGVYGQGTYALTDHWNLTAGVRETVDHSGNQSPPFYHGSKATWKVSTDYTLAPNIMAYATVATGYKGGGVNTNCSQITASCAYLPESVTDYEGGIKGRFFDRLTLTSAIFHYDYNNLQLSQVVPSTSNNGSAITATTNAAGAKIDGVEAEGKYELSSDSVFDFTGTWLHARYTNFVIDPTNPLSDNFNGEPLDNSPEWSFSAGYTYTYPFANGGDLVANVHSKYTDSYVMISQVSNSFFIQPQFTKTDISLTYNSPDTKWNMQAYVHNIEDAINIGYVNTAPLFGQGNFNNGKVSVGDPRTFGFQAGYKF